MKVLVITPEEAVDQELETCNRLLAEGLERLHIRKPHWKERELRKYIESIEESFRHKISLHQHHQLADEMGLGGIHFKSNENVTKSVRIRSKSCHSVEEIVDIEFDIDYVFLSPVFDSISKTGYKGRIELDKLDCRQVKTRIVALGGINGNNIRMLHSCHFFGVAILGSIWKQNTPEDRYKAYLMIKSAAETR